MRFSSRRPDPRAVVAALITAVVAACGATSGPSRPTTTQPPSPSAAGATIALTEADNHSTVSAVVGEQLTLTLQSTYWRVEGSADAAVVTPLGTASVTPVISGCVPGGGCGTVSMRFVARAAGTSALSATRSVCGEPLRCDAIQLYSVTVTVS